MIPLQRHRHRGMVRPMLATGLSVALGGPLALEEFAPRADPAPVYRGTDGPFEAIALPAGVQTGSAIRSVKPGGLFAWVSTLCVDPKSGVDIRMTLVRPAEAPPGERVVAWADRSWPAGRLPCGPQTDSLRVPRDAPPGAYELRRTVIAGAVEQTLPPIHIVVQPEPAT